MFPPHEYKGRVMIRVVDKTTYDAITNELTPGNNNKKKLINLN